MKKKILGLTFVIALAAIATFNLNFNKSESNLDFTMANVNALATESTGGSQDCYSTISSTGTTAQSIQNYCKPDGKCDSKTVRTYSSKGRCTN